MYLLTAIWFLTQAAHTLRRHRRLSVARSTSFPGATGKDPSSDNLTGDNSFAILSSSWPRSQITYKGNVSLEPESRMIITVNILNLWTNLRGVPSH